MSQRGKEIFDQRLEYPLPKQSGTKDYLFYFVPRSDGYGRGARYFFDKFYPNHVRKEVSSLEALIRALHSEVTGNGVSRIRELVIVAHGTSQGLIVPVLNNAASDPNLKEFRYVTPFSLACLQKDFLDGKFADFRQKRSEVISRLQNDSWVTIRACRVGSSADCLYALFSFFGGRANVYAPREFQFFGTHPIMQGMRLETKLEVHEHLVKQRFLPRDLHTPDRQDAVVRFLVDPAKFTEPFELASTNLSGPGGEEGPPYDQIIRRLNAGRIHDVLRSKFAEQGHPLSNQARVRVKAKDVSWRIIDTAKHQGKSYTVEYEVDEIISGPGPKATLVASATIADAYSAREFFPIQLFFYNLENDLWRGKLFVLAAWSEEPGANPNDKQKFDAILALLNQKIFSSGGVDIRAEFKDSGIDLSPTAKLVQVSTSGSGNLQRITWAVEDTERYLVKLEHPVAANGIQGHTLSVYLALEGAARLKREYELMSHLGLDPDTPGTELPAYLDRFSIDELIQLIDHLRSPYRPEHSYYIYHAQQAIHRKKEFFQWWRDQYGELAATQPLVHQPYSELEWNEGDDKSKLVYSFDFNGIWQEVKASHPSLGSFQNDLFTEENLWQKLGRKEDLEDRQEPAPLDPESPYADLEELRQSESQGLEAFFSTDKTVFEPPDEDDTLSCEEFAAIIAKWKDLQGTDLEEVARLLELETTPDGKSFKDYIVWFYDKYKIAKIGLDLFNIGFMRDGLLVKIVSRIPYIGTPSALGTPTLFTSLLRMAPAITIPLTMWLKVLEEQEKADAVWENVGRLTAIRQWLRELIDLTASGKLPDPLNIDLGWHGSDLPHIERYYEEQRDEHGTYFSFVWAPDRMKKGFDDGVRMMKEVTPELLSLADEVIGDVLREWDLDSCKMKVLTDAGILDLKEAKARVVRRIAEQLLEKVPRV